MITKSTNDKDELKRESFFQLPLLRTNFIMMAIAGVMIVGGFLLMTGSPASATEFNPDIFSARRIVVGPTIAFLGFIFMGVAIMWNGRKDPNSSDETSQTDNER